MAKSTEKIGMWAVMLAIRDARSTKGAQRELLYALALRARPEKGYSCFPSYAVLADDTGLNPLTLKRTAAQLERAGYLKRLTRRNSSNVFLLNVGKLVTEANEQKAARKKQKQEAALSEFTGFAEDEIEQDRNAESDSDDLFANREVL